MINRIVSRGEMTRDDIPKIDLFAFGQAHKGYTHKQRIFSVKLNSHFLPTASRMHMYNNEESARCKCCGAPKEDITHVLYCVNPNLEQKRISAIQSFEDLLHKMNTDPDIVFVISSALKTGGNSRFSAYVSDDMNTHIKTAAAIQDSMHRLQFHKGRLASEWGRAQRQYFDTEFKCTNRKQTKWTLLVISKINKLNMTLWENRNTMVQEYKKINEKAEEQERLRQKIIEEFHLGVNGIRPIDQSIIDDIDVEDVLRLSLHTQQAWLDMIQTFRKRHRKVAETGMTRMRVALEYWMSHEE